MDIAQKFRWLRMLAKNRKLSAADYAVCIALVDFHDIKTGKCNPSISLLAQKTNLTERSVRRSLAHLIDFQYIFIKRGENGKKIPNQYNINFPSSENITTPDESVRGRNPDESVRGGRNGQWSYGRIQENQQHITDATPDESVRGHERPNTSSAKGSSSVQIQKNPPIPPIVPLSPLPAEKSGIETEQKSEKLQKRKNGKKILPWLQAKIWFDYLNKKTGKNFILKNRKEEYTSGAKLAAERIAEHGLSNMLRIVDLKTQEWGSSPKWKKYLRPATLCAKINTEQYLGEINKVEIFGQNENFEDWVKNREDEKNIIEGDFRRVIS